MLLFCVQRAIGCTGTAPSSSDMCTVAQCPNMSYRYVSTTWSSCSQTCGNGLMSRQVYCADENGQKVSDVQCAAMAAMPAVVENCQLPACVTVIYSFVIQPWGSCSVSCGSGLQTRQAYCSGSNGAAVDNNLCLSSSPAPVTQQVCSMASCVSYSFTTTMWAQCSVTCGSGLRTRLVYCTANGAQQVADAQCLGGGSVGVKPSSSEVCSLPTCVSFTFVAQPWGRCSVTCGSGLRTRLVYCTANGAQQVANSACTDATAFSSLAAVPSSTETCSMPRCIDYSFAAMAWGDCSVSCGNGQQQRQVYCSANGQQQVGEELCTALAISKPDSIQACSRPTCLSFSYSTAPWGSCSVSCGEGFQTRSLACRGNLNKKNVSRSCRHAVQGLGFRA
jgi:hypothetical protein